MKTRHVHQAKLKSDYLSKFPWVNGRPGGYYFVAQPVVIEAPPGTVWDVLTRIDQYDEYSHNAVDANLVEGELAVGNHIRLALYPNRCVGKFIPVSEERISVVDPQSYTLAWERDVPIGHGSTECYRLLESAQGGSKTISHIALKIPGWTGFFTNALYKKTVVNAFNAVNHGVKEVAESAALKK